jgi:DNA-binding NtrC family response regulator
MKVLIVEDDSVQRELLVQIFKKTYRCEIFQAENGKRAYQMFLDGFVPDLVVLDLAMPIMDGTTLYKKMQEMEQLDEVQIIISTVYAYIDTKGSLQGFKDSNYLQKPFSVQYFRDLVTKISLEYGFLKPGDIGPQGAVAT